MSVINRVLKDLDQKGAAPTTLAGVQVVQISRSPSHPLWPWFALLIAGLAAAWGFWPATKQAVPVVREATPRLRLSETLSSPTLPSAALLPSPSGVSSDLAAVVGQPRRLLSSSIRGTGGQEGGFAEHAPRPSSSPGMQSGARPAREGATVDTSAKPKSTSIEPIKPEPSREFQRSSLTPAPFPPGEGRKAEAPLAVRLDTRLPEPRPAKVIKEIRPLTPREQADQAWRQAARLIEQGRGRDALDGLEAALRMDPGHDPARQTLIALSMEAGDTARCEALLREGMVLHANDPWYTRSLGQLYLQRGDTGQSAAILKAGLGKGVDAAYWGLYAGVLSKSGRHEEAAQAYREAARLNPGHGPWWIGLAVSLEQTGSRVDAATAYQRALQARLSPEIREFAVRKAGELAP